MINPFDKNETAQESAEKLSSEDLAALMIDALLPTDTVKDDHADQAIRIATEEIDVRKALGDY